MNLLRKNRRRVGVGERVRSVASVVSFLCVWLKILWKYEDVLFKYLCMIVEMSLLCVCVMLVCWFFVSSFFYRFRVLCWNKIVIVNSIFDRNDVVKMLLVDKYVFFVYVLVCVVCVIGFLNFFVVSYVREGGCGSKMFAKSVVFFCVRYVLCEVFLNIFVGLIFCIFCYFFIVFVVFGLKNFVGNFLFGSVSSCLFVSIVCSVYILGV